MSLEFLDPTHETAAADFALAGRLPALKGMTVGIISNGKFGTAPFSTRLRMNWSNPMAWPKWCGVLSQTTVHQLTRILWMKPKNGMHS